MILGGLCTKTGPERSTMGQVASAVGLATQDGDDGMCECCGQEWVAIVRVCSVDLSSLERTAIVAVCACWCVNVAVCKYAVQHAALPRCWTGLHM